MTFISLQIDFMYCHTFMMLMINELLKSNALNQPRTSTTSVSTRRSNSQSERRSVTSPSRLTTPTCKSKSNKRVFPLLRCINIVFLLFYKLTQNCAVGKKLIPLLSLYISLLSPFIFLPVRRVSEVNSSTKTVRCRFLGTYRHYTAE